jgi:cytochrome b subunit of formate dehydrogenase
VVDILNVINNEQITEMQKYVVNYSLIYLTKHGSKINGNPGFNINFQSFSPVKAHRVNRRKNREAFMVKKTVSFLVAYIIVVGLVTAWVSSFQTKLFSDIPWMFSIAIIIGIIAGIFTARAKLKNTRQEVNPPRHTLYSFMEHWGTGIGIILMIVSSRLLGLAFLPQENIPSVIPSNLHFTGLVFTLLFGVYFLADFLASREYRTMMPNLRDIWGGTIKKYLLRKKWNDTGKYLSSQKSAFLAFAVLGLGVLITGVIKTVGLRGQDPSPSVTGVSYAHDIFALLFILLLIVHIVLVLVVRSYRRMLVSWFTGRNEIWH